MASSGRAAYGGGMVDRLPASRFAELGLDDWRHVAGRLEANFTFGSFTAAGAFVARVAAIADEQQHHPDVGLAYPGTVHVMTSTHEVDDVSGRDVALATALSDAATELGAISRDPLASTTTEIAIDALDIDAVRPFWAAVLAYRDKPARVEGDTIRAIVDPRGVGPSVWFQQMEEPRPQRNRIHLDVLVPHDAADDRVAAAIAAGGRLVSDARARAFWVLADPEGNEACVCTWEDRGN